MSANSNLSNSTKVAPSAEQLLHGLAERLLEQPNGWQAVALNLSRLRPEGNRARYLRIAANTFKALTQPGEGHVLVLQQGDLVFLCKRLDPNALNAAIAKLRILVVDDPLSILFDEVPVGDFAVIYDLARDQGKFVAYVQQVYAEELRRQKRRAPSIGAAQKDIRQTPDPRMLADLIMTIAHGDFVNLLRRQPVCSVVSDEAPKPIYREFSVSIPDLRQALLSRGDIAADRAVFQSLTHAIDRRLLALLKRNEDGSLGHSFSVNLNVASVLSPDFEGFDQSLRPGTRGSIVIELEKADIFNDLGAYIFARDYLHERGYRICLDGVTVLTLPFIDRERLSLDLVKLLWSRDLAGNHRPEHASELRTVIDKIGKSRIILSCCTDAESVQFGLDRGVRLFQGKYVERLLGGRGSGATPGRATPPPAAATG